MAQEIERKFLVTGLAWKDQASGTRYRQGYIGGSTRATVRVRIAGDKAFVTIKGKPSSDAPLTRAEFEYEIPVDEARQMLDHLCDPQQIDKIRYRVPHAGHVWEVDEFLGANAGLIVAEIELTSESENFEPPSWLGAEVSTDPRYANVNLAAHPFTQWRG